MKVRTHSDDIPQRMYTCPIQGLNQSFKSEHFQHCERGSTVVLLLDGQCWALEMQLSHRPDVRPHSGVYPPKRCDNIPYRYIRPVLLQPLLRQLARFGRIRSHSVQIAGI